MSSRTELSCSILAQATGLSKNGAWRRLQKYKNGLISYEEMFAPPQVEGVGCKRGDNASLVDEIVAATGLTRTGAQERIRQVNLGYMPVHLLFATTGEIREWRKRERTQDIPGGTAPTNKGGDWRDLRLGPRKRPRDIPGGTEWEKNNIGR